MACLVDYSALFKSPRVLGSIKWIAKGPDASGKGFNITDDGLIAGDEWHLKDYQVRDPRDLSIKAAADYDALVDAMQFEVFDRLPNQLQARAYKALESGGDGLKQLLEEDGELKAAFVRASRQLDNQATQARQLEILAGMPPGLMSTLVGVECGGSALFREAIEAFSKIMEENAEARAAEEDKSKAAKAKA